MIKKITDYHQQNFTRREDQPIRRYLHKIHQTVRKESHNQEHGSKNPNTTRMLPDPTTGQTTTISPTQDVKNELD